MYKNEVTAEELVLEVRFNYFINNNEDPIRELNYRDMTSTIRNHGLLGELCKCVGII